MPSPDPPSLEQRLATFEAQNPCLRLAVGAIALGLVLYAAWHSLFAGPIRATTADAGKVIVRDPPAAFGWCWGPTTACPRRFAPRTTPACCCATRRGRCGRTCTPARN